MFQPLSKILNTSAKNHTILEEFKKNLNHLRNGFSFDKIFYTLSTIPDLAFLTTINRGETGGLLTS